MVDDIETMSIENELIDEGIEINPEDLLDDEDSDDEESEDEESDDYEDDDDIVMDSYDEEDYY